MALLLFYVLLALCTSFVCSVMEATLLSVTPAYVEANARDGTKAAHYLKQLKKNVDRPLAAILSLNTIANTIGAVGVGAQVQVVFGEAALTVASGVLTLLILVVAEIIPKTIGAVYWRPLAPVVVRVLVPLMVLLTPFVKLSELLTDLVARDRSAHRMSRAELESMALLGREHGAIDEAESRTMSSLLRFGSLQVSDAMTPRTVMFALRIGGTVGETLDDHPDLRFSRIPVHDEGTDDVVGYVLKDELLLRATQGLRATPLAELVRPVPIVHDDVPLWDLLKRLLHGREHLAIAVSEYGSVQGLITLEDLLETLLGTEIVDEGDIVRDMQVLAREQWRRRARALGIEAETMSDRPAEPEEPEEPEEHEGPVRRRGPPSTRTS